MSEPGLKPRVMWQLSHEAPLTVRGLTKRMNENYTSVASATRKLWKAGLLVRRMRVDHDNIGKKPYEYAIRVPEDSNE